jgi:hypothetical protein
LFVPETVVCFHPDADDCLNIHGIGATRQEAYAAMLGEVYEWHADRFESEEEDAAFYNAIVEAQRQAREDRARPFQGLASDTFVSDEVPF